jgi:hypothetical protein
MVINEQIQHDYELVNCSRFNGTVLQESKKALGPFHKIPLSNDQLARFPDDSGTNLVERVFCVDNAGKSLYDLQSEDYALTETRWGREDVIKYITFFGGIWLLMFGNGAVAKVGGAGLVAYSSKYWFRGGL